MSYNRQFVFNWMTRVVWDLAGICNVLPVYRYLYGIVIVREGGINRVEFIVVFQFKSEMRFWEFIIEFTQRHTDIW